jgi:hypothetical protein
VQARVVVKGDAAVDAVGNRRRRGQADAAPERLLAARGFDLSAFVDAGRVASAGRVKRDCNNRQNQSDERTHESFSYYGSRAAPTIGRFRKLPERRKVGHVGERRMIRWYLRGFG